MDSEETETKMSDRNGVSEETTNEINEEKEATKRKSDTINDSVRPPEKRLKSEDEGDEGNDDKPENQENNKSPEITSNDVEDDESKDKEEEKENELLVSPEEGEKTEVKEEGDAEVKSETEQIKEEKENGKIEVKEEEQQITKENTDENEEEQKTKENTDFKEEEEEVKKENTCTEVKEEEKTDMDDRNILLNDTSDSKVEDKSNDSETNQNDVIDFTCKKETKSSEKKVKSEKGPTVVKMNGLDKDDASSGKSEDSEKENRQMDVDIPMDLSRKTATTNGGHDVIMLSDSEEEFMMNGDIVEPSWEEIRKRQKLIKRYQSDLRNEEAKLVLLKKLKQSQVSHQLQEHPSNANSKSQPSAHKHGSQPPPLVRGSQQQPQQQQAQARPAHSQPPQLVRGNQVPQSSRSHQQGPPPLVNMGGQRMSENQRRMSAHMGYPGGMVQNSSPGNMMSNYRQSQSSQAQSAQQVDNQTPAQRQAAAKMALRKQLEKTLLQIPPPKPPPPEMNFVPSLASPDFISLLGLEEAVNYIIDAALISKGQKNPDEKMICNPFTCVQCNTDFTPVWKREKAGSKNVICEHCVTTNQKKALKQEHTNRLKSAFVKALQQEQEIERMQSQSSSSSSSTSSSNNQQSAPSASIPVSVPSSSSLSSFKVTSEALRQHQNFIQAHQAVAAHQTALRMGQPLGLAPFGARGAFPYQIPFGAKPSDLQLQRQYLLDMIPNRGQMAWKP